MERLQPSDAAPDVALYLPDGNVVRTPDLWRNTPVVLSFFRHFG